MVLLVRRLFLPNKRDFESNEIGMSNAKYILNVQLSWSHWGFLTSSMCDLHINWCYFSFCVAAGEQPWTSSHRWSALSSSSPSCPPFPTAPLPCCVRSGAPARTCCRPTRCFVPRRASSSSHPTSTARRPSSGWWTTSSRRWGTATLPTCPAWSELSLLNTFTFWFSPTFYTLLFPPSSLLQMPLWCYNLFLKRCCNKHLKQYILSKVGWIFNNSSYNSHIS